MLNSRFDGSKEVKYFKEITDFKNFIIQNTEIKRLQSLQKAEAYLEPKRISTMELFSECT